MYKKIKEISSVKLFLINKFHIVGWQRNQSEGCISYFSKNGFDLVETKKIENGRTIKKKNDECTWVAVTPPLVIDEYCIDTNNSIQCRTEVFKEFNPYTHNGNLVVGTTRDDDMNMNGIHCIDNIGNFVWTIKEASVMFFNKDNHLIYYNLDENKVTQLTNVNLLTGEVIWKKTTIDFYGRPKSREDTFLQLRKYLGCVDNKLYLTFNDWSVVEVDIETGIKSNSWVFEINKLKCVHPLNTFLLEDKIKIVGVLQNSFWEIDLKTSKMKVTDLSEEFSPQNISATDRGMCAFDGDYMIFPSEKILEEIIPNENKFEEPTFKYRYINQIVALNLNTLKVEWTHVFEDLQGMNFCSKVETDENYIYVLDAMQRLHIFGK